MRTFERRAFALAHAEAKITFISGLDSERDGYAPALIEYRTALLAGLERLFELRVGTDSGTMTHRVLSKVFQDTLATYLAIAGPLDGYLEAGLLFKTMAEAGVLDEVERGLTAIRESNARSREAHLDILTALLGAMLGDNADRVVHEDELRAVGVEPTPPNPDDYRFSF